MPVVARRIGECWKALCVFVGRGRKKAGGGGPDFETGGALVFALAGTRPPGAAGARAPQFRLPLAAAWFTAAKGGCRPAGCGLGIGGGAGAKRRAGALRLSLDATAAGEREVPGLFFRHSRPSFHRSLYVGSPWSTLGGPQAGRSIGGCAVSGLR